MNTREGTFSQAAFSIFKLSLDHSLTLTIRNSPSALVSLALLSWIVYMYSHGIGGSSWWRGDSLK